MYKKTHVFFKDFAISPRYYLHQLTIKLHPNRELKRSRRGVLIHDRKSDQFWIDFEWILDGFWMTFGITFRALYPIGFEERSKSHLGWILVGF